MRLAGALALAFVLWVIGTSIAQAAQHTLPLFRPDAANVHMFASQYPNQDTVLDVHTFSRTFTVGGGGGGSGFAPVSQREFDRQMVGRRLDAGSFLLGFQPGGRFIESSPSYRIAGHYSYSNTGPNEGTLSLTYDGLTFAGGSCSVPLTYASLTTGAWRYTCASGAQSQGNWSITNSPGTNVAQAAQHTLPLFRPAGHANESFARIINHSVRAGTVHITGIDDAGSRYGPVTLALAAHETRHFDSRDLEAGNPNGQGDWRLELSMKGLS